MLGHRTHLSELNKIEIITCILSNHSGMELEINQTKKSGKNADTWRLINMLLKNEWVNQKIKKEISLILAVETFHMFFPPFYFVYLHFNFLNFLKNLFIRVHTHAGEQGREQRGSRPC